MLADAATKIVLSPFQPLLQAGDLGQGDILAATQAHHEVAVADSAAADRGVRDLNHRAIAIDARQDGETEILRRGGISLGHLPNLFGGLGARKWEVADPRGEYQVMDNPAMEDAAVVKKRKRTLASDLSPFAARVAQLMFDQRMSARELSKQAGLSKSYFTTMKSGKTRKPSLRVAMAISRVLGEDLVQLLDEETLPKDAAAPFVDATENVSSTAASRLAFAKPSVRTPHRLTFGKQAGGLPVVGVVEAGAWRPREQFGAATDEVIDLIKDPRFPEAAQEAHLVRGDSMDQAGLHDGGYIRVIRLQDVPMSLRPGMVVVVERELDGGGLVERTVKSVELHGGNYRLAPRSSNRRHQPIDIPIDADLFGETATVRVLGFVTAFIAPIAF